MNDPRNEACRLCGLPVGRSGVTHSVNGTRLHFCCPGCLFVYQVLCNNPDGPPSDFRDTDLYRACVASGLIAPDAESLERPATGEGRGLPGDADGALVEAGLTEEVSLRIEGMWCPACSWLIEHALRKTPGVVEAKVAFLTDTASLRILPHRVSLDQIAERVSRLGYRASSFGDHGEASEEKRYALLRLGVSAILTVNIMMISFALYFGFFEEIGTVGVRNFSYPLWVLATVVVFYGGAPILKRAFAALRVCSVSMETLIALGSLAAYGISVVGLIEGSLHLYFDTAAMLITLVLLGKQIEAHARERVTSSITELYGLTRGKVRLCAAGQERWATAEAVEPGDEFLVMTGERIPVDGRIASGKGRVDESILTGESRPVRKVQGDEALGGALLLEGELRLRAVRSIAESSIGHMVVLMQEALTRKNPVELLADRVTRRLVPAVLAVAAGTALWLWGVRGAPVEEALLRAVTVLVITCPCALGIATPLAKVASIGVGRRNGLLIRDPGALEKMKGLDAIVFDKTGTVTEGDFSIREVVTLSVDREQALQRVAAVEARSDHFLARQILREARRAGGAVAQRAGIDGVWLEEQSEPWEPAAEFQSFEGMGVAGCVSGAMTHVGNRRLMQTHLLNVPPEIDARARSLEEAGATVVFFGWGGAVEGFIALGDALRESARRVIATLRSQSIEVWLVSGDSMETTRAIARELEIEHFRGQALPTDKVEIVKELQQKGRRVAIVGDGVNDAPALAQADAGIAFGTRPNVAHEASDITILSDDLTRVLSLFSLSALTTRVIRQNLFFAFVYNLLGIPLAVAGLLNPLIAVFAMFASSLTVIANTLRIARLRERS